MKRYLILGFLVWAFFTTIGQDQWFFEINKGLYDSSMSSDNDISSYEKEKREVMNTLNNVFVSPIHRRLVAEKYLEKITKKEKDMMDTDGALHKIESETLVKINEILTGLNEEPVHQITETKMKEIEKNIDNIKKTTINEGFKGLEWSYKDFNENKYDEFRNSISTVYDFNDLGINISIAQEIPSIVSPLEYKAINMQLKNDFYYIRDNYNKLFATLFGRPIRSRDSKVFYKYYSNDNKVLNVITEILPRSVNFGNGYNSFYITGWCINVYLRVEKGGDKYNDLKSHILKLRTVLEKYNTYFKTKDSMYKKVEERNLVDVSLKPLCEKTISLYEGLSESDDLYKSLYNDAFKYAMKENQVYIISGGILTGVSVVTLGLAGVLYGYGAYTLNSNQSISVNCFFAAGLLSAGFIATTIVAIVNYGMFSFNNAKILRENYWSRFDLQLSSEKVAFTYNINF